MLYTLTEDVLRYIFLFCPRQVITEVCRDFTAIAYSIPALWTRVHLDPRQLFIACDDGPQILRRRLRRAKVLPVEVSIQATVDVDPSVSHIAENLYATLSEFSAHIGHVALRVDSATLAGRILDTIFHKSSGRPFPNLHTLSVRLDFDRGDYSPVTLQLDKYLENAAQMFPMLQHLTLSSHFDCIPLPNSSFAHLRTLVLDGSLEYVPPDLASVVALLHHTPRLETLSFKHDMFDHHVNVADTSAPLRNSKGSGMISRPVRLSYLQSITAIAPGCSTDLLYCIEAPTLNELHLDGTHKLCMESGEGFTWTYSYSNSVCGALKHLASRSPNLHRLSLTSVYLGHSGWEWILFGDEGLIPPFPRLENISLHKFENASSGDIPCGFDDALLLRYSRERSIPLRRIAFHKCDHLALTWSALVQSFKTLASITPHERYEIEFDSSFSEGIEEKDLATLGIKFTRMVENMRS